MMSASSEAFTETPPDATTVALSMAASTLLFLFDAGSSVMRFTATVPAMPRSEPTPAEMAIERMAVSLAAVIESEATAAAAFPAAASPASPIVDWRDVPTTAARVVEVIWLRAKEAPTPVPCPAPIPMPTPPPTARISDSSRAVRLTAPLASTSTLSRSASVVLTIRLTATDPATAVDCVAPVARASPALKEYSSPVRSAVIDTSPPPGGPRSLLAPHAVAVRCGPSTKARVRNDAALTLNAPAMPVERVEPAPSDSAALPAAAMTSTSFVLESGMSWPPKSPSSLT